MQERPLPTWSASGRASGPSWSSCKPAPQEIEEDTQAARDRIQELEGEAAALKSEAEGKARGQSDLQERSLKLTQELSELNAALAALEAEREATSKGLEELESLRSDIAGDQEQSRALIGDYEEKNAAFTRRSGRRRPAWPSCAGRTRSRTRPSPGSTRRSWPWRGSG